MVWSLAPVRVYGTPTFSHHGLHVLGAGDVPTCHSSLERVIGRLEGFERRSRELGAGRAGRGGTAALRKEGDQRQPRVKAGAGGG